MSEDPYLHCGEIVEWDDYAEWPKQWHVVADPTATTGAADVWTLSPDPVIPGWSTDAGVSGYGLPKRIAEGIAERLNRLAYMEG